MDSMNSTATQYPHRSDSTFSYIDRVKTELYTPPSDYDEDGRGRLDHPLTGILIVAGIFLSLVIGIGCLMLFFYCKTYQSKLFFKKGHKCSQLAEDVHSGMIIGHDRDARRAAEVMSDDIYFDYMGSSLSDANFNDEESSSVKDDPSSLYIHSSQRFDIYSEVIRNSMKEQIKKDLIQLNKNNNNNVVVPKCPKHMKKKSPSPCKDSVSVTTILSDKNDIH